MASLYSKLGTCYQLKDIRDSILYFADQAYQLGQETGNLGAVRGGLKILIHHFKDSKDFETAIEYAEELLAIDSKNPSGYRSLIFLDFGNVYSAMGDSENAYSYFEQALEQALKDKYPPGIATARVSLAESDFLAGNLSSAAEQFTLADAMYERMNIEAARVSPFHRLGQIAFLQKDFSTARTHFQIF